MKLNKIIALTMLGCFALPVAVEAKTHGKKKHVAAKKHESVECAAAMKPASVPATLNAPEGHLKVNDNLYVGIHGYVKGIMNYDFKGFGGDYISADTIPYDDGKPADGRKNVFSMHAKETRFSVNSLAKTSIGDVKGRIEVDFYGYQVLANEGEPNAASRLRMRHAYLEAAGFLVGQTDSLFTSIHEIPTLNFADHFGGGQRHMQGRYTYEYNEMFSLAAAIEQAKADGHGPSNALLFNDESKMPDFTMQAKYTMDGHSVDLRGVLRSISYKNTNTLKSTNKMGWGIGTNMKINIMDMANFIGLVNYGQGIGRYMSEHNGQSVVWDVSADKMETQKMLEWGAGLSYNFNPEWQTNVGYSQSRVSEAKLANVAALVAGEETSSTKMLDRMFVNLMWSPVKDLNVGLEFMQARRKSFKSATVAEKKGTRNRVTVGVQWKF